MYVKAGPSRFLKFVNSAEKLCRLLVANMMELRLKKCEFLFIETKYFGFEISEEGIRSLARGTAHGYGANLYSAEKI